MAALLRNRINLPSHLCVRCTLHFFLQECILTTAPVYTYSAFSATFVTLWRIDRAPLLQLLEQFPCMRCEPFLSLDWSHLNIGRRCNARTNMRAEQRIDIQPCMVAGFASEDMVATRTAQAHIFSGANARIWQCATHLQL
jgi:hypothetical protein